MCKQEKRPSPKSLSPENIFNKYIRKMVSIENLSLNHLRRTTKQETIPIMNIRNIPIMNIPSMKKYKENMNMAKIKTTCEMDDMKEFSKILKKCYPYYAQYYHNATAGKRTEYGNEYVTIAYGKSIGELVILCESKGFSPTERIFDGGYKIMENPDFDPSLTQDDITRNMSHLLSKIFEKDK